MNCSYCGQWLNSAGVHHVCQPSSGTDRLLALQADVERLVGEKERWRSVALRIGEELADGGPDGYYEWTPNQLRAWAVPLAQQLRMTPKHAKKEGE